MTLFLRNTMLYINQFLSGLWAFILKYGIVFLAFIAPILPFLYCTYILLFVDLITGITKAVKAKEPVTSKRMRDSVIKFVFYSLAVFIAFQVDVTLFGATSLYLTRLVAGYIILIEFKSNMENISVITGVDLWLMIKDNVASFFKAKLKTKEDESNKDN